jgi:ERCC4-related helicase
VILDASETEKPRVFFEMAPYHYQVEIFQRILKEWDRNKTRKNQYGNIVYLETGMGKTHIAVMLLNNLFMGTRYDLQVVNLVPSTDEELSARISAR